MAWFDEIINLGRMGMAEIGFAFYVRENMKNELVATEEEMRMTLGPEWHDVVWRLKNAGVIRVDKDGPKMTIRVVAPGDKKRERCKELTRIYRMKGTNQ